MSIEFKMTFKELKRSLKIYEGYYRTGRIKRMRTTIPKHRWPALTKRIGTYRTFLIATYPNEIFDRALFGITRWTRH